MTEERREKFDRLDRFAEFLQQSKWSKRIPISLIEMAKVMGQITGLEVHEVIFPEQLHPDDRSPGMLTKTELSELWELDHATRIDIPLFISGDLKPDGVLVLMADTESSADDRKFLVKDLVLYELSPSASLRLRPTHGFKLRQRIQ